MNLAKIYIFSCIKPTFDYCILGSSFKQINPFKFWWQLLNHYKYISYQQANMPLKLSWSSYRALPSAYKFNDIHFHS